MKSTRNYCKRSIGARRKRVLKGLITAFKRDTAWHFGDNITIEITVHNRRNPNGIYARGEAGKPVEAGRVITHGWAKRNGYKW